MTIAFHWKPKAAQRRVPLHNSAAKVVEDAPVNWPPRGLMGDVAHMFRRLLE